MLSLIALKLPGATDAVSDPNNIIGRFSNIGGFFGGTATSDGLGGEIIYYGLYDIILWVSMVLMFSWMIWGVFQYLFAGGDKEGLAKAKSRITWAIVGFVIVILAYTIQKYAREIFPPQKINNTNDVQVVSTPPPIP